MRNAQGQIVAADGDYQDEIANLNSLLEQVRNDPTLRRLRDALAGNPNVQAQADAVAAALALANAPVLSRRDRESAAALSAFVTAAEPYFTDAAAKTGRLRDLLANKLLAADGAPQPFLVPLVAAGKLSREDLASLAAMGSPAAWWVDRPVAEPGRRGRRRTDPPCCSPTGCRRWRRSPGSTRPRCRT